jgi:hypothetical protein
MGSRNFVLPCPQHHVKETCLVLVLSPSESAEAQSLERQVLAGSETRMRREFKIESQE